MNAPVPVMPARARRVTARRTGTVRAAFAALCAVHEVLDARGYAPVLDAEHRRVWVEGAVVVRVLDGKLMVGSVEDGVNPAASVLLSEVHAPTADQRAIAGIAFAVELRIVTRRDERARLAAQIDASLRGYTCPGKGCNHVWCRCRCRVPGEVSCAA